MVKTKRFIYVKAKGTVMAKRIKRSKIRKTQKKSGKLEKFYPVISEVAGEEALRVVEYLQNKENISEFKIADATNVEVNKIRSMLYRLHEQNLVTYYRKKDRKKGWYISYWTFNQKGLPYLVKSMSRQKLEHLRERLVKEERNINSFYICPNICTRLDFETAVECGFRCPECGELIAVQDNSRTIVNLREKIRELEAN